MNRLRAIFFIACLATIPVQADEVLLGKQLDDACDDLRRAAIKSSYGWGWASDLAIAPDQKAAAPDMNLRVSAATGLLLHLAGKELNNVPHTNAAIEAARAMAAVQLSTGQIPSTARLVPKPGGQFENIGIVPDRGATAAALSMMLIVIEANRQQPDERLTSSATRAATWLARQQTAGGGWQSSYPPGPGPKAQRLLRLDDPGYRDATLALLLASKVLGRKEYATAADRSIEQLLRLRIKDDASPGKRLWQNAYTLGGDPVKDIEELPFGIDLTASRYSMETLLGARLVVPHQKIEDALSLAAISAGALPKTEGNWQRRYPLFVRERVEPAEADEADESAEDPFDSPSFVRVLASASSPTGPDVGNFPVTERLAQTICHLSAEALYVAASAVKASATQAVLKQNENPLELPESLIRGWELLLKVNQEQRTR
jgi:hypothetical protein